MLSGSRIQICAPTSWPDSWMPRVLDAVRVQVCGPLVEIAPVRHVEGQVVEADASLVERPVVRLVRLAQHDGGEGPGIEERLEREAGAGRPHRVDHDEPEHAAVPAGASIEVDD